LFFEIENIKGYECNAPVIEVYDNRGLPFYFFKNPQMQTIKFNLIAGKYYCENDLKLLQKPLRYEPPKLPKFEKRRIIHDNIEFRVEPNPNKASIDISKGLIIIDNKYFNEIETPFCNFLLFHELGHYYYKTEYKCDLFSAFNMLIRGFNPTQCYYANSICLSDRQSERKQILFNYLKKIKVYE